MTTNKTAWQLIGQILDAPVGSKEKIILVAVLVLRHRDNTTQEAIAAASGLHRVTVQRTLAQLREQKVISPAGDRGWYIDFDALRGYTCGNNRGGASI